MTLTKMSQNETAPVRNVLVSKCPATEMSWSGDIKRLWIDEFESLFSCALIYVTKGNIIRV